jgi:hypothetical protein
LNKINLTFCHGIVGGGVEGLSKHCCDLQIIKISYSICTDADLLALSTNCQQLQEIYLDGCKEVTDDGLIEMSKHLSSNKQFRRIDISNCELISDGGVIGFSKNCPQLKSFAISGDNFTMNALPAGFWTSLGVGFYLTISRNTAGILNVRFEDLNGNMLYQVSSTAAVTYAASTLLWAMYGETNSGTTGAIMNRGLTLEGGSNIGSWSNWHDAFGPVLSY